MGLGYRAHDVIREDRADGTILLRAATPLGAVAERTTDWLDRWAEATPDAVMIAERSGAGWREMRYAELRERARAVAGGLLDLGLGPDAPILIVSGNSVAHAVLSLAAQHVGVPVVPLAEQYALIPAARGQIDHAAGLVRPGAVFAEDGAAFADLLARESLAGLHRIVASNAGAGMTTLDALAARAGDIASAQATVGPETVAKVLLTSGSTSAPKGVPTTHRMMCANQAQLAWALPFVTERAPTILDWLPWNHVFGGSHNFNLMLANGGALYVDGGKPTPQLVGLTIENMRSVAPTISFNVPVGFAMVRGALRDDAALRRRFFERLDMLFYAGASLPQDVWADLEAMARAERGDLPLFTSSWGLTETAPAVLLQHQPVDRSGVVGVPLPGAEVKLVPDGADRHEVRVRGPNVFGGYLDDPARTAEAFDDEGFFATGDAMRFVAPSDPNLGLAFDGRIAEEFKLLTGTWVRAAGLRLDLLDALRGIAADVVVCGADRAEVGVMVVPSAALRDGATESDGALIPANPEPLRAALAALGGPSSRRVRRAIVLAEPPSVAEGEMTAKGNLNFRRLLTRRAALLERLYDDTDPATILTGEPR